MKQMLLPDPINFQKTSEAESDKKFMLYKQWLLNNGAIFDKV